MPLGLLKLMKTGLGSADICPGVLLCFSSALLPSPAATLEHPSDKPAQRRLLAK